MKTFQAILDSVVSDRAFISTCRSYVQGLLTSDSIVMAVLTKVDFGNLYLDAMRYRYLRDNHVRLWESQKGGPETCDLDFTGKGHDLDAAIDAAVESAGA